MTERPAFALGRYRHYKGNDYDAIDLVRHSETCEWMVLYRARYGDCGLWVRPLAMFTEHVVIDGIARPRFALLHAGEDHSPPTPD
ncbi:DUF1653 domain-containing protein [Chitiniphilus eburneus]|uniref:DUF1653 domain-containing protein n=1 Tax=Chitiniphilus eburneus TaxID=2571148 RepID=A0A4U0Q565_9NEIS|nr:DUF1653 domain-containing protein [Chitiniphilus eburneus]TJZ76313.1 DUF1653 domain-containing protein [Chitiniphilus eburneus]